jgi:hypothetical protein
MGGVKRFLVGAAAVVPLAAAGVLAATAAPAAAYPNLCTIPSRTINYTARTAHTQCTGGSGWFRVRISCRAVPNSNFTALHYGEWLSVEDGRRGSVSFAVCPSDYPYIVGAANILV